MSQFNTEDVYNYIVLLAQNDGDAYADGENAEAAVDGAIRDMKREVSAELRGDTRQIREPAIAAVRNQWRGGADPVEQVILHNPSGKPVVVLHLRAKNDTNGNPQRLWMIVSDEGQILDVIDEGYGNLPQEYRDIPDIPINLKQGEYRNYLRWWKQAASPEARAAREERMLKRNPPELELDEAMRASIGAALGGFVGAYGGLFTAAIAAAVGSLIGSNWKKVTAGMSAATRAYKTTPARSKNPRPGNRRSTGKKAEVLMARKKNPRKGAEEFFYGNAGYSYDPKTQTEEEGRRETAKAMADAEQWAWDNNYTFSWSEEEEDWDTFLEESEVDPHDVLEILALQMRNKDGTTVQSLGGVMFGHNAEANTRYGRVFEAELALQQQREVRDVAREANPKGTRANNPGAGVTAGQLVGRLKF